MSSFFEKLKKGMGIEENEKVLEKKENFEIKKLEEESPQTKKKLKREKKIKTEAMKISPQKISEKETDSQEKSEEKKWPEPEGQLAIDVYQTKEELIIQTVIAGVKPEDLDITAQGDLVIIKGKREKIGDKEEERNYFYQECYWGPFSREIILPLEADIGRAEATMTDGILTIRMPKIEREKIKKITIK